MFRDTKTGEMFTMTVQLDDNEEIEAQEFYDRVRKGLPISEKDRIREFERQHKLRQQDKYSGYPGITGQVFQSGQLAWTNDMKSMPEFQSSIDNLGKSSAEVRNIICAPLFGHRQAHELESDPKVPIAVLQLINKQHHKPIIEYDLVSAWSQANCVGKIEFIIQAAWYVGG